VNQCACEALGYTRAELLQMRIDDIEVGFHTAELARLWQDGPTAPLTLEGSHRRKDGSTFSTESRIGRFDSGGRSLMLAVVRDIAERKAAAEEIQRSLSMLQATLESTADGLLVVDLEGRMVKYNQRCVDMWRVPQELLATGEARPVVEYVMGELKDPQQFFDKVYEVSEMTDAESFDILEFRDGRIFERFSRPQYLDGQSVGRVWSFRDVTRQRQLEDQLRQSQKLEAIGQLAGGVAHDFNNLLTVISGHVHVLLDDDPQSESLDEIRKAADRAASLTQQLLAFSRRQVLQPRVIVLRDVVKDILPMLRRLIGENIELGAALTTERRVKADPGQLQQVIMNLALNARDAMPDGGRLTISVNEGNIEDEQVAACLGAAPGPYMVLTVRDTGVGMDQATQAHVFEPFFTTKGPGKGTGLGLAMVYGIVTQSGGCIRVSSELGRGSVFEVYLPRVEEPLLEAAQNGNGASPNGNDASKRATETVLLVEDDEAVRNFASEVLKRCGFRVHVATNGEQALAMWDTLSGSVDVLLTDVIMPKMSGTVLADRLRHTKPGLPVLFMTGYTDDALARHVVPGSRPNFIQKPFLPHVLAARIRGVLEGDGARR
jgi:two-component system cell cycle sensor histidine kinase/response regulator CckA